MPAPEVPVSPVTVFAERIPWWWWFVTPGISVLLLLATWPANLRYGDSPWASAALTLGAVVVVGFVWRAARPRGPIIQVQSIGIVAVSCGWTICAVIAGPWTRPVLDVWILATIVAWVVTSAQRVLRSGQTEVAHGGADVGAGLLSSVKALKDARLKPPKTVGAKVRSNVEMRPGVGFSEVVKSREDIASALDVPVEAVRTIPDPDSARRGDVEVVPVDLLKEPIPSPGPSEPGGSMADPLLLGRVEDGEDLELYLPGDGGSRNATHVAVVGMSGAGKTELLLRIAEEVLTRVDAELWVGDRRKGAQLPSWVLDGAARVALDSDSVEAMLDDLIAEVASRAAVLGSAGFKQWLPGAPIPFRVVMLDEAGGLVAKSAEFVDLSESCRSVGISLVLGLQRASHDRMSTSARSNIGVWLVMGVKDEGDVTFGLSDAAMDAGAAPWKWGNGHPGYLYAEIPGTDPARWAMPARGFEPDPQGQEATVRQVREALGLPMTDHQHTPRPAETQPADIADDPETETLPPLGEPPDDVDPSQPIDIPDDLPRIPIAPLEDRAMSPAEARTVLVRHIQDRAAAGHEVLRPAELADVLVAVGRSRPWLSGALKDLCGGTEPLLRMEKNRGHYRILVPAQAGQP